MQPNNITKQHLRQFIRVGIANAFLRDRIVSKITGVTSFKWPNFHSTLFPPDTEYQANAIRSLHLPLSTVTAVSSTRYIITLVTLEITMFCNLYTFTRVHA